MKKYEFENYKKDGLYIYVDYGVVGDDEGKELHIYVTDFESWLKQANKLEWSIDTLDKGNDIDTREGEFTIEQYWDNVSAQDVLIDLQEYFESDINGVLASSAHHNLHALLLDKIGISEMETIFKAMDYARKYALHFAMKN